MGYYDTFGINDGLNWMMVCDLKVNGVSGSDVKLYEDMLHSFGFTTLKSNGDLQMLSAVKSVFVVNTPFYKLDTFQNEEGDEKITGNDPDINQVIEAAISNKKPIYWASDFNTMIAEYLLQPYL